MTEALEVIPPTTSQSTLAGLYDLGFSQIGESRDFTNDSIQVVLARGSERLTWVFPMKKAVIGINTADGASYLQIAPKDISFDVVLPSK